MILQQCRRLELPKIQDERGSLTFIERERHVPFEIKRVYYLYDVPSGEERAGHAHRRLYQALVSLAGSFDVTLDDGWNQRVVTLNRPYVGLLIVPGVWRVINNFSSGSVCLVMASDYYDESDYIRDYDDFIRTARS